MERSNKNFEMMIIYRSIIINLSFLIFLILTIESSGDELFGIEKGRYIVLIVDRLGLANRLRTIADWYNIASLSNRVLLVTWKPALDCNISFTDLFEAGPQNFHILPFAINNFYDNGHIPIEDLARRSNLTYLTLHEKSISDFWAPYLASSHFVLARKHVMSADIEVIITSYDSIMTLEGIKCQQYFHMHSNFLSSLVPTKFARDFVAQVIQEHFSNKIMIGIHIRVHDSLQDWEVVPPLMGSKMAGKFGEGATLEDFETIMRQISQNFRYVSPDGSVSFGCKFFIASNSQAAKDHMLERFPESVAISGTNSRVSHDGMIFSLIEWLLLSESALVVNTHGSSFAIEAAMKRLIPLIGIWDHRLIHHSDIRLPYCGHLQYLSVSTETFYFDNFFWSHIFFTGR